MYWVPGQADILLGTTATKTSERETAMKKQRRALQNRIATTVGDLVAAAWEASPGLGLARAQRVAVLLAVSPLSHHASRPIQFER